MPSLTDRFERSLCICSRCNEKKDTFRLRNTYFCRECFVNFVGIKVSKQLNTLKFTHLQPDAVRRVLLPISGGTSSLTLLQLISKHVERVTAKINRQPYDIHVCYIDESTVTRETFSSESLQSLKQEFPNHHVHVSKSEHIFNEAANDASIKSLIEALPPTPTNLDAADRLRSCLANLPSDSAVEDIVTLIRVRLAVKTATSASCNAILWGESSTRLAERILGETASGKGFSLPWQVNDVQSPYGVTFMYPLRDLSRSEVTLFAELSNGSITRFAKDTSNPQQIPVSSDHVTVGNLMSRYFQTVEQSYPNIVSNVVRTTTKLLPSSDEPSGSLCDLCGLPTPRDPRDLHDWQGYQQKTSDSEQRKNLCYGCMRTRCG